MGVNLNLRQRQSSEHCSILTSPAITGFTYGFQTQTFSYHTYFHCTEDERVPGRLPPAYRSAFSRELKSISVLRQSDADYDPIHRALLSGEEKKKNIYLL